MKRMLAVLLSLALILSCAPAQVIFPVSATEAAADEIPAGLIWQVLADGTVAISRYTGTAGELTIPSTIDGRPVTVIGQSAFYGCSTLTAVRLPDTLKRVEAEAFRNCQKLKEAVLPDSVTYIGSRAFYECRSLTSANVPEGVTVIYDGTFTYCESMTALTLPDSVTEIQNHAFQYCKVLPSVTLPKNLKSIGSNAFYYCWELSEMSIPDSVTDVGEDAFLYTKLPFTTYENSRYLGNAGNPYLVFVKTLHTSIKTLTIHPDTKVIASRTFQYNKDLTSVSIPEGLVSLESGAFYSSGLSYSIYENGMYLGNPSNPYAYFMGAVDNTATSMVFHPNTKMITEDALRNQDALLAVTIPDGVTTIARGAFFNCIYLQTVFMGNSVTSIGTGAFSSCYKLELLSVPANLKTIGERAFSECYKLTSFQIPAGVTDIGKNAFGGSGNLTGFTVDAANAVYTTDDAGALLSKDRKTLVAVPNGVTAYTVPDTVTTIGNYAFSGCKNLTAVTLSDSVTTIGQYAFNECRALTSLTLPDSVTTVEEYAFYYCTNMTSLTLGKGVSTIGNYAFDGCFDLKSIVVHGENAVYSNDAGGALLSKDQTVLVHGPAALTEYTVPDSVRYISDRAFGSDSCLETVTIGNNVTYIGNFAFYYCDNLTRVTFGSSVRSIGRYAFYGCKKLESFALPETLTTICGYAFGSCAAISSLTLPDSLTTIETLAFQDCTGLTTLNLGAGVTSVTADALRGCSGLTTVTVPEDVVSMTGWSFASSANLQYNLYGSGKYLGCEKNPFVYLADTVSDDILNITIPSYTRFIGPYVLYPCQSMTGIWVDPGSTAFYSDGHGVLLSADRTVLVAAPGAITEYTIPNTVTTVADYAFYNHKALTSVTIPSGVTAVGNHAFYGCEALSSLSIGTGLTAIGEYAFYGCTSLTAIDLPSTLTAIGNRAFSSCSALERICFAGNAPAMEAYTFSGVTAEAIYPAGNATWTADVMQNYGGTLTWTAICPGHIAVTDPAVAPSCTENGLTEGSHCSACGEILVTQEEIPALGHEEVIDPAVAPTETTTGLTEGKHCGRCGEILVAQQIIPVLENIPDGLAYEITSEGTVTITDYTGTATELTIPATIQGYSVTSIGNSAFSSCDSLTSVTIPDSVTSIGNSAFSGCHSLTSVTIPDSVTSIGDQAFWSCESLTSVTIPDSVTTIGDRAFDNCDSLASITIGDSVTSIGDRAFKDCTSLTSVTIPDSVTYIGNQAFSCCNALTGIWVDKNNTAYCNDSYGALLSKNQSLLIAVPGAIKSYTIPDSVTSIGNSAFEDCDSLTSITIPDSVTYIGEYAFTSCTSLTSITIPDSVTTIGDSAFSWCTDLQSVTIPDSITYIGEDAFTGCFSLTSITLPDSVTTIGDYAFSSCTSLTSVTIPDSVTTIGDSAFSWCTGLQSVTIPDSVISIGYDAFSGCYSLTSITFKGDAPTSFGSYAFSDVTAMAYYPAGNATWTADVMQNYGGTLTWTAFCPGHIAVTDPAVAPSCTENGLTEGSHCSACGEILVAQEEIPALGHEEVIDPAVAPTCTETGLTQGSHCSVCGEILVPQEIIVVTIHLWDAGIYTEPNTEADGYTTYTCTVCGATEVVIHEGTKIPTVENAITWQPEAVTADSGTDVQFHVEAEGTIVSYKWQYRKLYKWFDTGMTGYNTNTLTVPAVGSRNGYDYRCEITFADGTVLYSEPAELTVNTYINITYHPNDQVAVLGYKGQFTAAAVGESIQYQWQYQRPDGDRWIDTTMDGCTKATVNIETTTARDGYKYRCRLTDAAGLVAYTNPATMYVLSVTEHPSTQFSPVDKSVQFSVATSVDNGFSYEWQYSRNGGTTWTRTTMDGYNTATLTVGATLARNGYQYRCVLTGAKNSKIESKPAILYVGEPVEITSQPADYEGAVGENAVFNVTATNVYSYQWQYQRPDGDRWIDTSADGNKTPVMTIAIASGRNGYQYRCKLFGLDGNLYYTQAVTLTAFEADENTLRITAQPLSQTVAAGTRAQFAIKATCAATYQWQYCRGGSTTWYNTSLEGYNTDTLTVAAFTGRNGYQYRCIVADAEGMELISNPAVLTVGAAITAQPADFTGAAGQTATFAARAKGTVTYTWQYRQSATGSWFNTTATGYNTDTLSVSITSGRNGYQYRCKITDESGVEVFTDPATLTVGAKNTDVLFITAQPADRTADSGTTALFAAAAQGEGIGFRWYYRRNETAAWTGTTMTGWNTSTLSVSATAARNGYQYRCVITDSAGNQVTTDPATLTVE